MQFEGNWTPVADIVVDKVGKYAYVIGSPHDAAATPVVMDVVLDVRTKVPLVPMLPGHHNQGKALFPCAFHMPQLPCALHCTCFDPLLEYEIMCASN